MQETWAQSLGWEDLLEKGMATHSSILAWRVPWTEEPVTRRVLLQDFGCAGPRLPPKLTLTQHTSSLGLLS